MKTAVQTLEPGPTVSPLSFKQRVLAWAQPETLFLCFSLLFGIVFALITPPFQVADEYQHFNRSYVMSKGQLFAVSGTIPRTLDQMQAMTETLPFKVKNKIAPGAILRFLRVPLQPRDEVPKTFLNVGVYSPLPYLPQTVGALVGRLAQLPPLALFWLVRLCNLAFWVFVCYHALKRLPILKWVFLVLLLLPMSIYQAASASADAFTNAIAFLTIAVCLRYAFGEQERLRLRDYALLMGLCVLLAFSKTPYIFLVGLYLLIPLRKHGGFRRFAAFSAILLVFVAVLLVAGNAFGQNRYTAQNFRGALKVDPQAQMRFILDQPVAYAKLVLRTYRAIWQQVTREYVGVLGYLETFLPQWVYSSFLPFLLILLLLDYAPPHKVSLFQRVVALLPPAIMLVVIASALFVTWTTPGKTYFEGFQGRYLIPILPPVTLFFYNNWGRKNALAPVLACSYALVLFFVAANTILNRFYLFAR